MVEIETPLVLQANERFLNEKQRVDYETYRRKLVEWLKALQTCVQSEFQS